MKTLLRTSGRVALRLVFKRSVMKTIADPGCMLHSETPKFFGEARFMQQTRRMLHESSIQALSYAVLRWRMR